MAAVWPAQRWLKLTKESTWGIFDASALAADILWIRLMDNAFNLKGDPRRWMIRSADGGNLKTQTGTRKRLYQGSLRTALYPTQAIRLLAWAFPTGSGSAIALPSFTADYQCGYEVERNLGCRIGKMTVRSDDESDNAMLTLDQIVAKDQTRGTVTLSEPASSVFPTEAPYHHGELTGQVSVGGSTLTGIRDFMIEVTNILYHRFHESSRIDRLNWRGRDTACTLTLADPTGTNRTRYEDQVAIAASVGYSRTSPAHVATFNLQANDYISSHQETGNFGEDLYEAITLDSLKDPSSGVDVSLVVT
jgi:hypothetical protein